MARRARFVRPPARSNVWLGLAPGTTETTIPGGQAILIGSLNAAALALRPFTIVRTRGIFSWRSDQSGADESSGGIAAFIVVTQSAVTAGIGSIPTPFTEPNSDFFVYQPLWQTENFATAVGEQSNTGEGKVFSFDSKGMRKVGQNDDIALLAENISTTQGSLILINGRMLVKLH